MDGRALTRLRVAFLLLGAALLLPLGLLLRSVDARLEAQRRLRHELVAERIFDEMERELTGLLQRESARPSAAYADTGTHAANWAPFVVGYFTRDTHRAQIIAKSQLAPERVQRLEAALNISPQADHPKAAGAPPSAAPATQTGSLMVSPTSSRGDARFEMEKDRAAAAAEQRAAAAEFRKSKTKEDVSKLVARPEDVLKALNRAQEERDQVRQQRPAPTAKRKLSSASRADEASQDDPLSGF